MKKLLLGPDLFEQRPLISKGHGGDEVAGREIGDQQRNTVGLGGGDEESSHCFLASLARRLDVAGYLDYEVEEGDQEKNQVAANDGSPGHLKRNGPGLLSEPERRVADDETA